MNTYSKMKRKHRKEIEEFPMFFAFNMEQFVEGMKNFNLTVNDTDKIVKGVGGSFMLKKDTKKFADLIKKQDEEMLENIKNDKTGEGFIFDMFDYELSNHEYCITYDEFDTLEALGLKHKDLETNPALKHGFIKARENQKGNW